MKLQDHGKDSSTTILFATKLPANCAWCNTDLAKWKVVKIVPSTSKINYLELGNLTVKLIHIPPQQNEPTHTKHLHTKNLTTYQLLVSEIFMSKWHSQLITLFSSLTFTLTCPHLPQSQPILWRNSSISACLLHTLTPTSRHTSFRS